MLMDSCLNSLHTCHSEASVIQKGENASDLEDLNMICV